MGSSASWRLVGQGEHAPCEVSGETIVGRSKEAGLHLPEGFVSRRHARLWLESGRLMIEDLGSVNGTFVNGERLTRPMRLGPGDRVTFDVFDYFVEANDSGIEDFSENDVTGPARFGEQSFGWPRDAGVPRPIGSSISEQPLPALDDSDFNLTGESATLPPLPDQVREGAGQQGPLPHSLRSQSPVGTGPDQPRASLLAATVDMSSGESPAVPRTLIISASAEHPAQASEAEVDPSAPALLATSGPLEGSLIHLEPGRILLGRGVECDIWIDHPAVSRQHLEIFLSAGRCQIRQMEGAQGALLNGNPVGDAELIPGDVLHVGSVEFVYDSVQRLTEPQARGLPPWVWMLVGFSGAGAILAGMFMFVL